MRPPLTSSFGPSAVARARSAAARRAAPGTGGDIEQQLRAEAANALRRAGDRLEDAIDTWKLLAAVGAASPEQLDAALDDLVHAAWALLVQRECAGFRVDNLGHVRRHYDIPDVALRRL